MGILLGILLFIFIAVCILLIFMVLIQSDKGGGISGAIGGGLGGANSLLGTQDTANILTRGTQIFGGAFLVLCIVLSVVVSSVNEGSQSQLKTRAKKQQETASPASILNNNALPLQNNSGVLPVAPAASTPATPATEAPSTGTK
jgi:preprotein translocase subunit SecG